MESKYFICPEHNQDTQVVCWTCNTHMCRFCLDEYCYTYDHDTKNLLESIKLMKILDENIKMFMQDNRITIQDNLDLLEQEIKNNKQIITRLRELKQYLDKRLDHHYLQSLETVFSILENRLLSSIDQFTETKKNITKYLDNFNSKKSVTQLLVQVLDWFKEKNRLCSYKIYSLTIKEYDIIDQLFNDYYKSEHSPTSPPTGQQQFLNTLNECIDIKESRDTRPLLCYPIINSYKFYDLPQHPIVDPINNIKSLDDYKNILIKLEKNFSTSAIVGDRQLIDLFNSKIRNLTSVLIVYHPQFYDKYKFSIQYHNSNIKTIIITHYSDFKAKHPNVNIFGEYVLEPLSNEGLEFLFNNLKDAIISKDDVFYKPLMYSITQVSLKSMIESLVQDIRDKTNTPNEIIYDIL
ncbi:hypothetical protein CYY_003481 [Polysphondylium violaceum]|uniref:Uncharacterized protein n=1 Tax=Polysphondylium violaceum TaxID=133409 RepID=A0A8J4PWP8_9MYCE|nr:hypothetical protein CYY_003481 [Polysphondylium violaceum]